MISAQTMPEQGRRIPEIEPGMSTLDAALAYVAEGLYIVPIKRGDKNPGSVVGKGWQDRSSNDPKQVAAWFAGTDYDIALHAGRSGIVVIDVDAPENVPEALRSQLESDHPIQITRSDGSGRAHHLFSMPPGRTLGNSTGTLGNGWGDIRGRNGVIVVEPSQHSQSSGCYRWVQTGRIPVLPAELAAMLPDHTDSGPRIGETTTIAEFCAQYDGGDDRAALEGLASMWRNAMQRGDSRHATLNGLVIAAVQEARSGLYPAREAFDLIGGLFTAEVSADGSRNADEARSEFRRSIEGAISRQWRNPAEVDASEILTERTNSDATPHAPAPPVKVAPPKPRVWSATELEGARQPEWLARQRIPKSAITLLVGDEGIGKSLFWVWLAALVTRGRGCPEFGIPAREPQDVLIVVTEDDWATAVLPRLKAADADLSRVKVICSERDGSGSPVFPADMGLLHEAMPFEFVVVDAWLDTLPPNLAVRDPQQARIALHPWSEFANQTGTAVILLTHTNRQSSASARDRYGVSGELRKKARATLFAQHDDDGQLVIGPEKANATATVNASRFTVESVQMFAATDSDTGTIGRLRLIGDAGTTAGALTAAKHESAADPDSADCVQWLQKWMDDHHGTCTAKDLKAAAGAECFTQYQLNKAKRTLGIESRQLADGWVWVASA